MFSMSERDWRLLLGRIKAGKCTPFLGAGASAGVFPLGAEIAGKWAEENNYPLRDSYDLARVAQYLAVTEDPMAPKEKIQNELKKLSLPDFNANDEPHGVLADLPLPIYITTNYDDSMIKALKSRNRDPRLMLCRWNDLLERSINEDKDFTPTPANPVVFHLHGHLDVSESLVLTEDDYLDFLINISKNENLIPPMIQGAMAGSSLLFLGYRLADWDFRVLFRSIVGYLQNSIARAHISVQIAPEQNELSQEKQEKVQEYLESYFAMQMVRVYWGSCREFATELRNRWVDYNSGN